MPLEIVQGEWSIKALFIGNTMPLVHLYTWVGSLRTGSD